MVRAMARVKAAVWARRLGARPRKSELASVARIVAPPAEQVQVALGERSNGKCVCVCVHVCVCRRMRTRYRGSAGPGGAAADLLQAVHL